MGKKILGPYFHTHFSLQAEGELPPPPFLLIANHLSALDPFFIDALSPYPIVWVANRLIFEHPLLGPLIRAMDAIPKRKAIPDGRAVRGILRVLGMGGVVGLFPEGAIPWDGVSQEVAPGTEELLHTLQVPVVLARIQGAWMRKPLWADHSREGPVSIRFTPLSRYAPFSLRHSEWEWQRERRIPFYGGKKAEGFERVMLFCPVCQTFRSIVARGNMLRCLSCRLKWGIDAYGFIDGLTQEEFLRGQENLLASWLDDVHRIPLSRALIVERTYPEGILRGFSLGSVVVEKEGLRLQNEFFPFTHLRGANTFLKKVFEFTFQKRIIRIHTAKDAFLLLQLAKLKKAQTSCAPV